MGIVLEKGYSLEAALRSVGEGWRGLIRELWEKKPTQTRVIQVKEKFGGLRVYTDNTTDDFERQIDKAVRRSFRTCEACGSDKVVETKCSEGSSWLLTLCQACRDNETSDK